MIENCNGEKITDPDSVYYLTFSYTTPSYLLGDAKSEKFNVEELMIQINPIVCISGTWFKVFNQFKFSLSFLR